jgi:hypothetical protein
MRKKAVRGVAFLVVLLAASLASRDADARRRVQTVWHPQPVMVVHQPVVVQQPVVVRRAPVVRTYHVGPRWAHRPVWVW